MDFSEIGMSTIKRKLHNCLTCDSHLRHIFIPALILLCLLLPAAAGAATYYVDVNGNDQNQGTLDMPWATLHKAVLAVSGGDTIIVKEGAYELKRGLSIDKASVSIKAYPGHKPVIKYTGPNDNAINIGKKAPGALIEGLTVVWSTWSKGNIIGIGSPNATIRNCHIYFEIKPAAYDCIKILNTGHNSIVENCEIHGAPEQGIDTVGGNNLIIRNNKIYDCQNAIVLKGGSRNDIIENNLCYNFRYGAIGLGGHTGFQFNLTNRFENLNSIVRNNIVYYEDPNNIGGGIFLWGAQGAQVYHNTVVGPGIHVRAGGDPNKKRLFESSNNQIFNNIIWTRGNDGIFRVDEGNADGLELRNNLFWRNVGSGEFCVNGQWMSYAQFKKQVDFDKDSIFANPQFKDIKSKDFSLSSTSPAIGNAYPVPGMSTERIKHNIGAINPALNQ